jgi:hypothetical protein
MKRISKFSLVILVRQELVDQYLKKSDEENSRKITSLY